MNSFESHSVLFFAFYILFSVYLHCNSLSIVMSVFFFILPLTRVTHLITFSFESWNKQSSLDEIKSKGSIISQVLHSYLQRDAARCWTTPLQFY